MRKIKLFGLFLVILLVYPMDFLVKMLKLIQMGLEKTIQKLCDFGERKLKENKDDT